MTSKILQKFTLACTVFIAACGGGGSSTPVVMTPSVSDIKASPLALGQSSTFTVSGTLLDPSVYLSAQGCTNLVAGAATSSSSQAWTCTIDQVGTGAVVVQAMTAQGVVLKSQSFDVAAPTTPYITAIEADQLMYTKTSQFTISGYLLTQNIKINSKNCKGLALVAGGTANQKTITCTISAVGKAAVSFEALSAEGSLLKSKAFDVPVPQVTMLTNLGTLVVELDAVAVPVSTSNFLQYVNDKFYDNTIIHRIVKGPTIYVAQGGSLTSAPAVQVGLRPAIALEVGKGLSNLRGTIAMARTTELNSATAQYFFNLADNVALDTASGGYAVFGKITTGLSVLDAVSNVGTSTQYGLNDFPTQSVLIQSVIQTQ